MRNAVPFGADVLFPDSIQGFPSIILLTLLNPNPVLLPFFRIEASRHHSLILFHMSLLLFGIFGWQPRRPCPGQDSLFLFTQGHRINQDVSFLDRRQLYGTTSSTAPCIRFEAGAGRLDTVLYVLLVHPSFGIGMKLQSFRQHLCLLGEVRHCNSPRFGTGVLKRGIVIGRSGRSSGRCGSLERGRSRRWAISRYRVRHCTTRRRFWSR